MSRDCDRSMPSLGRRFSSCTPTVRSSRATWPPCSASSTADFLRHRPRRRPRAAAAGPTACWAASCPTAPSTALCSSPRPSLRTSLA
eukprot:902162-Prymnesium_polylepis.2